MNRRRFLEMLGLSLGAAVTPKKAYFFLEGLWRREVATILGLDAGQSAPLSYISIEYISREALESLKGCLSYQVFRKSFLEPALVLPDFGAVKTVRLRAPRRFR